MKDWREFQKARLSSTIPAAERNSHFTKAKLWASTTTLPHPCALGPERHSTGQGYRSGSRRGQVSTGPEEMA